MRNCVRPHALLTTGVSWLAVRLCAPDALHLVWDSGTVEIVLGVVFPLTVRAPPFSCCALSLLKGLGRRAARAPVPQRG